MNYIEDRIFTSVDQITSESTEYIECIFENIDFNGFDLSASRFVDCQFISSNLSGCTVTSSSISNCTLRETKLMGINWTTCNRVTDLKFNNCVMNFCVFQSMNINFFNFIDCELKECDFSDASLKNVDFTGSNLTGSFFSRTNLEKANFERAHNYSIDITSNIVKEAKFSYPEVLELLAPFKIKINS